MPDNLSAEDRRKTMRAVKGKGTGLERRLFAMLAGMRLHGWRKNADDVIGKPDVVFDELRVAVFVDGCFWHGCPVCQRKLPETNREYWERKIQRNVERDRLRGATLEENGWRVVRIWEHEMRPGPTRAGLRARLREAIAEGERGAGRDSMESDAERGIAL